MSCWRQAFLELATGKNIFARWHTKDGGYVYMYVPKIEAIGEKSFLGESVMQFDEIEKVDVPQSFKHGNVELLNDLDFVESALCNVKGITVTMHEDVLSIELS
jgi:hypothetical protein